MFCPRCGRELPDGTPICPDCGMVLTGRPVGSASPDAAGDVPGQSAPPDAADVTVFVRPDDMARVAADDGLAGSDATDVPAEDPLAEPSAPVSAGAHFAADPAFDQEGPSQGEPAEASLPESSETSGEEGPAGPAGTADAKGGEPPTPGPEVAESAPEASQEETVAAPAPAARPQGASPAPASAGQPQPTSPASGADGPLYVSTYGQFRAEDPGETQYMTVPFIGDIGVVSPNGADGDADDPGAYASAGHFAVPDSLAQSAPIEGGVPEEHYIQQRRERRRRAAYVIVGLVVVAVLGFIGWYTWDQELWGGKRVPGVVGLSLTEAESALTVKGLSYTVEEVPSDDGFDTVVTSDPAGGERCLEGESVTLGVAVHRTIPNVVGLRLETAQQQLQEAGATNVSVEYENSSAEEGTVLSVTPEVGSQFVSSDAVTLTVARPFEVPDVVGLSEDDARSAIEGAGLVCEVSYVESDAEEGKVLSVSPEAGTVVEKGSTVTISLPIAYPSSPSELAAYYRITPQQVSGYLTGQGFTLHQGGTYSDTGDAYAVWDGPDGDRIYFTDQPESYMGPAGTADELAQGLSWDSIRYLPASSQVGDLEVTKENAEALARSCGLSGSVLDSCTSTDITTPYSLNSDAFDIACIQGESDGYVWVVLLYRANSVTSTQVVPATTTTQTTNEDGTVTQQTVETSTTTTTTTRADTQTTAVVAYLPTTSAQVAGLEQFGGSFCDYFAYANTYSR